MLNENFIYKLARPVLGARKELSRSDFNTIYSVVQKNEHAAIESILRKYNVHVVESAKAEQSNKANFSSRAKAGQNYDYRKISRLGNEMLCVMAQEGNELALKAIVNKNKGFGMCQCF